MNRTRLILAAAFTAAFFGCHPAYAGELAEHQVSGHCVDAIDPANCPVSEPVEVVLEVEVVREVEVAPEVAEQVSVGIDGDTAGGCDLPNVYLSYSRVSDGLVAGGRVKQGGNRACKSATSADIGVERDFGSVSIELGYDLRGMSFVGPSSDGAGDDVFYGSLSAATAVVNYEFDYRGVNIETGYNIPGTAPRMAASWSSEKHGVSAEIDVTGYENGPFSTMKAAWNRSFGDQWGVEAFVSFTLGTDNAPDPVTWSSDRGASPLDPPTSTYGYGIGISRSL